MTVFKPGTPVRTIACQTRGTVFIAPNVHNDWHASIVWRNGQREWESVPELNLELDPDGPCLDWVRIDPDIDLWEEDESWSTDLERVRELALLLGWPKCGHCGGKGEHYSGQSTVDGPWPCEVCSGVGYKAETP